MTGNPPQFPPSNRSAKPPAVPPPSPEVQSEERLATEPRNREDERSWLIYSVTTVATLALLTLLVISMFFSSKPDSTASIAGDSDGDGLFGSANINVGAIDAGSSQTDSQGKGFGDNIGNSKDASAVEKASTSAQKPVDAPSPGTSATGQSSETDSSTESPNGVVDAEQIPNGTIIPLFSNSNRGQTILSSNGINPLLEASEGNNTIFVIDNSPSMLTENRLNRVKRTLIEAIDRMEADQEFLVIFFSTGKVLHPRLSTMSKATRDNKDSVMDWIEQMGTGNGTDPLPAVSYALEQNPEKIVLLSDGEFPMFSDDRITTMNHGSDNVVPIDCVGVAEFIQSLKSIATANGNGRYYQAR